MTLKSQTQVKMAAKPLQSFASVWAGLPQRRSANLAEPSAIPPIVREVLRSPGQPLNTATRTFMEPRFGHDFSQVRVHTDATAAKSARAVNALAYTVGRNVIFAAGQYAPTTMEGKRLLAHELTHVVQQKPLSLLNSGILTIHRSDDHFEKEADAIAQSVATLSRGNQPEIRKGILPKVGIGFINTPTIQRKIALNSTNETEVRQFFKRHKFADFSLRLREKDILVETASSTRPSELEQEIFWSLAHSKIEYPFTLDQLRQDVNNRISIVHAARTLGRGRQGRTAEFGAFKKIGEEGGVRLNEKYWDLKTIVHKEEKEFDVIMRSKKDHVTPSQAIEDIWRHPEEYAYECFTSTAFIQHRALLLRIGEVQFNRRFPEGIELRFTAHTGPSGILKELEQFGLAEQDIKSDDNYDELIPGDQAFFKDPKTQFVENTIYAGGGKFFAHPQEGFVTAKEIEDFWKARRLVQRLVLSRYRYRLQVKQ